MFTTLAAFLIIQVCMAFGPRATFRAIPGSSSPFRSAWSSRAVVRVRPGATRRPPSQQECVELRSRAVVRGSPGTTRRPPSQQAV
ncbi:uncharacterized protein LOC119434082 isoform X3 [Dermacentor silvarum]|uniref:uncharacterized protein LOC119434082 isoform X2 n=1 Tax=Dermacentor silvarum TaxID=543639 RepID=UPI002100A757|nr:uncharacterized protein LOC119434082 isoform X2 [Dermacentor silvarum]XP_049514475.1 uncharacterized protein LOC119434082 isoform X3 [Dermacentor silvarum]